MFELGDGVGVFVAEGLDGLVVAADVAAEADAVAFLVAVAGAEVGDLEPDFDAVAEGEPAKVEGEGFGVEGEGVGGGVGEHWSDYRTRGACRSKRCEVRGTRVGGVWWLPLVPSIPQDEREEAWFEYGMWCLRPVLRYLRTSGKRRGSNMECGASSSFLRYLRTSGKKRGSRVQRWGRSTRAHSGLVVVAPGMSAADDACESWVLRPYGDLVPEGCGLRAETRRAAAGQAGEVIQMTGALGTPALPIAWRSSRLAEKAMASSGVSKSEVMVTSLGKSTPR